MPIRVIGVGNDLRGDDAVGLEVARALRRDGAADMEVHESSGDAAELMRLWEDSETVIVIDAVNSGANVGTVVHFEVGSDPVPAVFVRHVSSHGMGLAESIGLAGALDALPATLHVYGVEGSDFAIGSEMSPAVREAAETLAHRLRHWTERRRSENEDMPSR